MGAGIVVLIVVVVLAVAGVGWMLASKAADRRLAELRTDVDRPDLERSESATCMGVASKGTGKSKGLGVLALSADQVEFKPVAGEGHVVLERAAITGAGSVRTFLGKESSADLLHLTWTVPTDEVEAGIDEGAWRVADVDWWIGRLAVAPPS